MNVNYKHLNYSDTKSQNKIIKNQSDDDLNPEFAERILNLKKNIIESQNIELFYASTAELSQIYDDYCYCLQISKLIWDEKVGICLYNCVQNCDNNPALVTNVFFLLTKLMKLQQAFEFFCRSDLPEKAYNILFSYQDEHLLAQSINFLSTTLKLYYNQQYCPYDLMKLLSFFQSVMSNLHSSELEKYILKYIMNIILYINFYSYVNKMLNIFYFILKAPKYLKSIKYISNSLKFLIQCDIRFYDVIFRADVIQALSEFLKNKEELFCEKSDYVISYFKFLKIAILKIDHDKASRLIKMTTISDLRYLIKREEIQPLILSVYISVLFLAKRGVEIGHLEGFAKYLEVILKEFTSKEFSFKIKIIEYIYHLLKLEKVMCYAYQILMKHEKTFFEDLSFTAFNANKLETTIFYIKSLRIILRIADNLDETNFFLENFFEAGIDQLLAEAVENENPDLSINSKKLIQEIQNLNPEIEDN